MGDRLLIGVIATDCYVDFERDIMSGIISQAFKSSCDVAVISPLNNFYYDTENKRTEKQIFNFILSDKFDGFIYDRNSFYGDDVRAYIDEICVRSGKPVMLLDHNGHKIFETTSNDDSIAFEEITDHLIEEHGYKKIYCLTGPKNIYCSDERLKGYFHSMKKHNLFYDKSYYYYGDFWTEFSVNFAEKIIKGEIPRPEAIICGNDTMAIALIDRLVTGGINVPEDIAVTGFDASMDGYHHNPSITSYRRPNFQLGADAFKRLYRIITGKISARLPDVPGELRVGRSCGCSENVRLRHDIQRRLKIEAEFETRLTTGDMLIEVTNTNTLPQLVSLIDNHTYLIYKMNRIYTCITQKMEKALSADYNGPLDFDINEPIKIILNKTAIHRTDDTGYVSANDFLDKIRANRKLPSAFYLSPVHYNNSFFGFCALSFGKHPITYTQLYTQWIKYIDVAFENLRIRSAMNLTMKKLSNNITHDDVTGLLNDKGLEAVYMEKYAEYPANQPITYICIELPELKKTYYQNGNDETLAIIRNFADILKSALYTNELCSSVSPSCYSIILFGPDRSEEIFYFIKQRIESCVINMGHHYGTAFTMGAVSANASTPQELQNIMHKATVSRVFSYTHEDNGVNPQFEKICKLRSSLMKYPDHQWKVSEIADEMFISKSYLQKIYKQYFNRSIIEELIYFRMEKAKKLLTETDMTVTDIARDCGYSTYNYFVRQFKTSEEMSPSEYRELHKF